MKDQLTSWYSCVQIVSEQYAKPTLQFRIFIFIRTKRSERAKRAHSVLREVEKMGYKNFFAHTRIG